MADLKPGSVAWVDAMVAYTRKTRPDCAAMMERLVYRTSQLDSELAQGTTLLMHLAFEAGRTFQQKNPGLALGPINPGTVVNPID